MCLEQSNCLCTLIEYQEINESRYGTSDYGFIFLLRKKPAFLYFVLCFRDEILVSVIENIHECLSDDNAKITHFHDYLSG